MKKFPCSFHLSLYNHDPAPPFVPAMTPARQRSPLTFLLRPWGTRFIPSGTQPVWYSPEEQPVGLPAHELIATLSRIDDATRDEITDTLCPLCCTRQRGSYHRAVWSVRANIAYARMAPLGQPFPSRLTLPNLNAPTLEIPVVVRRYGVVLLPSSMHLGCTGEVTVALSCSISLPITGIPSPTSGEGEST